MRGNYALFIASLKQASMRNATWCIVRDTSTNVQLTKLLVTHGYLSFYTHINNKKLCLYLKISNYNKVVIKNIHTISNSGKRVYKSNEVINSMYRKAIVVVNTSKGFFLSKSIDRFIFGGELIFELEQ